MRISDWSSDVCSSDLRPSLLSWGKSLPVRGALLAALRTGSLGALVLASGVAGVGLLDPVGVALGARHGGGVGGAVADQAPIGGGTLDLCDKSGVHTLHGVTGVNSETMLMGLRNARRHHHDLTINIYAN